MSGGNERLFQEKGNVSFRNTAENNNKKTEPENLSGENEQPFQEKGNVSFRNTSKNGDGEGQPFQAKGNAPLQDTDNSNETEQRTENSDCERIERTFQTEGGAQPQEADTQYDAITLKINEIARNCQKTPPSSQKRDERPMSKEFQDDSNLENFAEEEEREKEVNASANQGVAFEDTPMPIQQESESRHSR